MDVNPGRPGSPEPLFVGQPSSRVGIGWGMSYRIATGTRCWSSPYGLPAGTGYPGACLNGGSGGAIGLVALKVEGNGLLDCRGGGPAGGFPRQRQGDRALLDPVSGHGPDRAGAGVTAAGCRRPGSGTRGGQIT